MTNLIKQFDDENIQKSLNSKSIPDFQSGDTVQVDVRITDGATERIQTYEGVVIARRNKGICSSFVVRKVSHGEGVERRFMIYSPVIENIRVIKRGMVRRAKLFYLRKLSGRAARIPSKHIYSTTSKLKKETSE